MGKVPSTAVPACSCYVYYGLKRQFHNKKTSFSLEAIKRKNFNWEQKFQVSELPSIFIYVVNKISPHAHLTLMNGSRLSTIFICFAASYGATDGEMPLTLLFFRVHKSLELQKGETSSNYACREKILALIAQHDWEYVMCASGCCNWWITAALFSFCHH